MTPYCANKDVGSGVACVTVIQSTHRDYSDVACTKPACDSRQLRLGAAESNLQKNNVASVLPFT